MSAPDVNDAICPPDERGSVLQNHRYGLLFRSPLLAQTRCAIAIAVLLSLLASGLLRPSYAKPPIKKLTYARPAEPRYDSYSTAPGHFEFTVKKTELLPSAEEILLKGRGDKKLIRPPEPKMGAIAKNGPLTGSATKRNPLTASASGTPLYGATTGGNRRPLQGTVNSTTLKAADTRQKLRNSSLSTVEHGLRPRFYVDFAKMTPKFAPKLSRLIDAELENARLTVPGDVARSEKLMNQELRARPPQPDIGSIPAKIDIARLPTKSLQSELQKSKQQQKQIAETAAKEEDEVRRNAAKNAPGKMPGGPGKGAPLVIPFPDQRGVPRLSMPSISKQNISAAEQAMNQELANIRPPSKAELAAQLAAAGTQAKLASAKAQPAMDLVLTSMRQPKSIKMPAAGEDAQEPELDAFATIQWDQWHAKFAEASRDPILQSLKKYGNPSGENTVEITVSSDGRITVTLNQASKNANFDKAVLQAYRSMERHPALRYPPGSRRSMLTFLIDVKHIGEGAPSSVKSRTSVGDNETVRKKKK